MQEQTTLTPDQISERITTALGLAYDLYGEVESLLRLIREGLEASDADITPLSGQKHFMLPSIKKDGRLYRYLKTDLGFIADVGSTNEEDTDAGGDDEEEDEADSRKLSITADTQILGVRAILYSHTTEKSKAFQPVVVASLLNSITRTPGGKKKNTKGASCQESFSAKASPLKRLVKQAGASTQVAEEIRFGSFGATIAGISSKPLASFNSEESVNTFVEEIVRMVDGE